MGQSPLGESYNFEGFGEPLLNGPTELEKSIQKKNNGLPSLESIVKRMIFYFV